MISPTVRGSDPARECGYAKKMAFLTRTDPARDIDRFYIVDVPPTLFGEWAVLHEWGRRGSPGTVRLESFKRRVDARNAEARTIKTRLRHGYR